MKSNKKPKGISDSNLLRLWRLAVKIIYGNNCVICGKSIVECHHIVHRRYKLLRWAWRNGIPVCPPGVSNCHAFCDLLAGREKVKKIIDKKNYEYLMETQKKWVRYKDYLRENDLSETEWKLGIKKELEEIIKRGNQEHENF